MRGCRALDLGASAVHVVVHTHELLSIDLNQRQLTIFFSLVILPMAQFSRRSAHAGVYLDCH